eukprot:2414569-Pyramimonas_sp.AAC.1
MSSISSTSGTPSTITTTTVSTTSLTNRLLDAFWAVLRALLGTTCRFFWALLGTAGASSSPSVGLQAM